MTTQLYDGAHSTAILVDKVMDTPDSLQRLLDTSCTSTTDSNV